jgi:WD40 repeat protein
MRNLLDRRRWGWARILYLTLCAGLLVIGPGADASTEGPEVWVGRYNGPGNGDDQPFSVAASPDGSRVFVTGWSGGITSGSDYATVAYGAGGAQLWATRYNGPGNGPDEANSLTVSPDGAEVFVTGGSWGITGGGGHRDGFDYATVSYDAATGTPLWRRLYNGPAHAEDSAYSMEASPDGSKVFVTGRSWGITSGSDYATVAYDAAGTQLWVSRYNGPYNGPDEAHSVTLSPDGTEVFVTGVSVGTTGYNEYATVAYDAATGAQLWESRYVGQGIGAVARSMAVGPDGTDVFVTGVVTIVPKPIVPKRSEGSCTVTSGNFDWHTVAYDATTGTRQWVRRYGGLAKGDDEPHSVAASPDGTEVFVTGRIAGTTTCWDYMTVAYDAATGTPRWRRAYNGRANGDDAAHAMAVSPDGTEVFVTGVSAGTAGDDYATLAYDAATGAQLWLMRYDGPAMGKDNASSMAASPDGSKVFVTGGSWGGGSSGSDYATVAYAA